jgi:predicted transcriptional regulator of viral defense system
MNFLQFKSSLKDFPVFSTAEIRTVDASFDRRRLSEWQGKGYIRKITKGLYIFSDVDIDEGMIYRIANKLYRPSYVSLESALAHYQLIPESIYGVTSVSTRRTYSFETPLTHFSYRTVSPRFFFGYTVWPDKAKIATVEKALLDTLYLNPSIDNPVAFDSLRIDRDNLADQLDDEKLHDLLERFGSRALSLRLQGFLERMRNA